MVLFDEVLIEVVYVFEIVVLYVKVVVFDVV